MLGDARDRIEGCILGGAVGDALGAPLEFMSLGQIRIRFGADGLHEFAPAFGRVGAITDDTQMTLFTAEGMIRAESSRRAGTGLDPDETVHRAYLRWLHTQSHASDHPHFDDSLDGWLIRVPGLHSRRAPGKTCLEATMSFKRATREDPINHSKGCGAVMRIAPVGLLAKHPFELGCRIAALTHGHPTGYLAAGFMADLVSRLIGSTPPQAAAQQALRELGSDLNDEVRDAVAGALRAADMIPPSPESVESLGQGWVAEEALAIALYCALTTGDFVRGVQLAVNHGGDSDSTGSLTGNILGAALGRQAIPAGWLDQLELRDEVGQIAQDVVATRAGAAPDPTRYPPR